MRLSGVHVARRLASDRDRAPFCIEDEGMRIFKRSLLAAVGCMACCATALGEPARLRPETAVLGLAAPSESVDFSLHLPLQNVTELDALIENQSTPESPLYHHFLSPAQFRVRYGPDPERVQAVLAALRAAGIQAAQTSTQIVSAHGPAAAVEQLFSTRLSRVASKTTGRIRVAALAPYRLPDRLARTGAIALNLRSGMRMRALALRAPHRVTPANRSAAEGDYWADDLKQAYAFPAYTTANGAGVSVAIVAAGDFSDADLALYLRHERVGPLSNDLAPAPQTTHFYFPGAPQFNDSIEADAFEADLDAQQIALTAPGAALTGFVTSDGTDLSFLAAYAAIVELNRWDIVSNSFALCELFYLAPYNGGQDDSDFLRVQNEIFKQGNAQGITFVTASGDSGALSCPDLGYFNNPPTSPPTVYDSVLSVNALASLPNTIAVGGGDLRTSHEPGSLRSTYVGERGNVYAFPPSDPYGTSNLLRQVFAATGGASAIFPRPHYQRLVDTGSTMRTVPDVGGHTGSYSGGSVDLEYFDGLIEPVVGTSASAPDFAGLLAIKAGVQHSRLGLENPDLYTLSAHNGQLGYWYFHQNNPGRDGFYRYTRGHQGYNYIYGVGSPHAANFALLPFSPLAGDPQTATNP
jgi:subtilase family serine protease